MAKFKVVITDHEYDNIENEKQALSGLDVELLDCQYKKPEDILRVAKDADALIIQYAKMPRALVEQLDRCKVIARYATGFDGIDLQACTEKGIYVCNVSDYCREEVSTYALSLLLEMTTRVGKHDAWTHQGNWFGMPGKQHSLKHQVIGVVSFGRIAKSFIDKIKPLCDNIWVYDVHGDVDAVSQYGAVPKTLDEIYEGADYISLHCPLTDQTRHLIDRDALQKMKKSAVLINVARGAVVSEADLVWALENGEIAGAALDVLEQEPPEKDNPLFRFDNVIISPHAAWYSEESQAILQRTPAEDVARVLRGELPLNLVNKEILNQKEVLRHTDRIK